MQRNRKSNKVDISKTLYDLSGILLMIMLSPIFFIWLFAEIFCDNPKYK